MAPKASSPRSWVKLKDIPSVLYYSFYTNATKQAKCLTKAGVTADTQSLTIPSPSLKGSEISEILSRYRHRYAAPKKDNKETTAAAPVSAGKGTTTLAPKKRASSEVSESNTSYELPDRKRARTTTTCISSCTTAKVTAGTINNKYTSKLTVANSSAHLVSLYTTEAMARYRAERPQGFSGQDLKVCKISGRKLGKAGAKVVKLEDFMKVTDGENAAGEFVVWGGVPKEAVVECGCGFGGVEDEA